MAMSPIAPGTRVHVKARGKVIPAVVVGSLGPTSLVWVRVNEEEPLLVNTRDILDDPQPDSPPDANDDPALWETETF
jgi:hypothetical protein